MTSRFAGMSVQGSGTWKLDGEFLDYSAGALTGRIRVVIAGTVLTLSPDPVVVLGGKSNGITKYERARARM